MNRRLQIAKRAFKNTFAFLLILVAFARPFGVIAQDPTQLDTLISQRRFLELQIDTPTAVNDSVGFFKKVFQVFKFRDNRNRTEKERFNEIIKEKIDMLTVKIDSISTVQRGKKPEQGGQETKNEAYETNNEKNVGKGEGKKTDSDTIKIPQPIIKLDSLKFEEDPTGLMEKIFGVFKFKSNRDRTERERVQKIIQELIIENNPKGGPKLRLDTIIINSLTDKFIRINKRIDSLKIDSLSREKAAAAHVDYLKRNLDTVNNALEDDYEKSKEALIKQIDSMYTALKEVAHSCNIKDFDSRVAWDTISKKADTLVRIKKGIEQRIKVMGWHNVQQEDNSEDYQFNFLSSINYFGFKLMENGLLINTNSVSTSNIPKVIESAHKHGCDVYLTIYNNDPKEITAFLESNLAQEQLFIGLEPLLNKDLFNGINVYFEELPTNCNDQFKNFIKKFGKKLKGYDDPFELIITIPAIIDESSLEEVTAYDFKALNEFADYYLILTNNMINSRKGVPQSLSPLYKKSNDITGTVQSTIEFYSSEKIQKDKLFIILPYSGVEWQINYNGDLSKGTIGKELKYGEILKKLESLRNLGSDDTVEGFNPKEVSAYVVFSELDKDSKTIYKEIWYDDPQSLYRKYEWALKQGLGGVSIRNLGYDDGAKRYGAQYLALWKALAAATSKIDTCKIETINKTSKSSDQLGYLECFVSDANWAKLNELGDDYHYWRYSWTQEQKDSMERNSVVFIDWEKRVEDQEELLNGFIKWDRSYFQEDKVLNIDQANPNDPELQTDEQYFYLLLRWRVYGRVFLLCFFILLVLDALLSYQRTWYKRYPPEKELIVKILNFLQPVFIFLTLICFLGYLYFDPWVDIGGDLNQWIAKSTFFYTLRPRDTFWNLYHTLSAKSRSGT